MKQWITIFSVCVVTLGLVACKPTAQNIVDEAIEAHGGKKYKDVEVAFDFRDKHYVLKKQGETFHYERHQTDSTGTLIDVLDNKGFSRTLNNKNVVVADSMAKKYTESINSVAYFFWLPEPLNDPAVQKELKGEVTIKGQKYDQIFVTFRAEGGGNDHDDQFLYWINKTTKTVDYFAYSYARNGGGIRFREAFNCQTKNGIRFCDYRNYGFEHLENSLESLPTLFEEGKIPLASTIENKNVLVK